MEKRFYNCFRTVKHYFPFVIITIILQLYFAQALFAQKLIKDKPRPKWVDRSTSGIFIGISHQFPDETDARADALNDAKRQIIESLGGIIESEFIDEIVETTGEVTSSDAFTNSKVKVVARNIISVKPDKTYIERWKKREGFRKKISYKAYVAVPFSESAHRKFMKELVDESYTLGDNKFKEAMKIAGEGNIFLAIDQLRIIRKYIEPLTTITGLSPSDLAGIKKTIEDAEAKVKQLSSGVRIEGLGDKQTSKFGAPLANPLGVFVFCQHGEKKIPLSGLKTDFKIVKGRGTVTPISYTDDNGVAECRAKEIMSAGRVEITADIHFPEGYDLEGNAYVFHILPQNKVIVKIVETNLEKPVEISYLENTLLQELTTEGFTALENDIFGNLSSTQMESSQPEYISELASDSGADLVMVGVVSSGQVNQIQEGFYFARAKGVLRIFNIERQSVVKNIIIEDKEAGNSEENAGAKAIKKVSNRLITEFVKEMGL